MSQTLQYRVVPVLGGGRSTSQFLKTCNNIVLCMGSDAAYASLATLITGLKTTLAALTTAESAATGPTKSTLTVGARNGARKLANQAAEDLLHGLKKLADANPSAAVDLVTKAGCRAKKRPVQEKAPFRVKALGGGAMLAAIKSPGARRSVEFQGSPDDGKSWPYALSGSELSQRFENLTAGIQHSFRYRVKLPNKPWTAWSDAIKAMVI